MKILSFIKTLFTSLFYICISPLFLILPKYQAYLFVLTTGRSGSGTLANLMKNSGKVNAFHEPYPILNNTFNLSSNLLKFWIGFQFYFIKVPRILLSKRETKIYYLETNHLFLKAFSGMAKNIFRNKMKIIHLRRPVELVAKSMFEIGKWPGTKTGNKWYLNPDSKNNIIHFNSVFKKIKDVHKDEYLALYQCIWYWFEMEERIKQFKNNNSNLDFVYIETTQLNEPEELVNSLNHNLNIEIPPLNEIIKVDRNLKKDEKLYSINNDVVLNKVKEFQKLLQ